MLRLKYDSFCEEVGYTDNSINMLSHVAFGATMLASSALNNLFVTYYLELFSGVALVSSWWFYCVQIVFGLWNAINDPLFGWLSDQRVLAGTNKRTDAIRWGGLLWSAAFVLTWYPWPSAWGGSQGLESGECTTGSSSPTHLFASAGMALGATPADMAPARIWSGLHFLLSLCLYDGLLTLVEVNHGALLAEVTRTPGDRAKANMWSAICAAAGSLTSWIAHITWSSDDLRAFRTLCLAVAASSAVIFWLSAAGMDAGMEPVPKGILRNTDGEDMGPPRNEISEAVASVSGLGNKPSLEAVVVKGDIISKSTPKVGATAIVLARASDRGEGRDSDCNSDSKNTREAVQPTPIAFVSQLIRHRNFLLFVWVSVIQVFDCTFEKHFFAPFMDALASGGVGAGVRGAVVSASFLLPHVATVLVTPLIRSEGLHWVLAKVFRLRLGLLGAALLATAAATASVALVASGGSTGREGIKHLVDPGNT